MCSPASFETAYVQRASPTEPIVVTCAFLDVERVLAEDLARRELDEALDRVLRRDRGLERVVGADHVDPHRPHRALERPCRRRRCPPRGRRACNRRASSVQPRRGRARRPRRTGSSGASPSSVPESASRWRLSIATTSFSSTSRRASVVPMKPAPPVTRIRLPVSGTRRIVARPSRRSACGMTRRVRRTVCSCASCSSSAARSRCGASGRRRRTTASRSRTSRTSSRPAERVSAGRSAAIRARGTHPRRAAACRELARLGWRAFRPVPQDTACTRDLRRPAGRVRQRPASTADASGRG